MGKRRWGIVALAAAMATVSPWAGHADATPGLVVDDEQGDALWPHDTSLNASWADLTQARMATVRDDQGNAAALQLTFVTAAEPGDDDDHRVFYHAAWSMHDGVNPWCTGSLWVFDGRPDGGHGPPRADLYYSCDGDGETGPVYLDLGLIRAHVGIFVEPDGTVTPTRDGTAVVVTIPLGLFTQGLSNGRYVEGAVLSDLTFTSGVLWRLGGVGMDQAGAGLLQWQWYRYTIGA